MADPWWNTGNYNLGNLGVKSTATPAPRTFTFNDGSTANALDFYSQPPSSGTSPADDFRSLLLSQPTTGSYSSGGSGYAPADHFFDVNPLDQASFDAQQANDAWNRQYNDSKFAWQKSLDDRDYALAAGNLDLARQKQSDANYWEGQSLALQQSLAQLDASTRMATAQMDAQTRIQTATIAAEADRYNANVRFQESMANARNDEERNRIALAHEQEIARIAKMEDDTKRAIASQEQRISGFNAETSRAAEMGNLALKNNQFILDASTSPRDLFGLYFMQRGVTPDWQNLINGGAPTIGDALRVYDPMKAYVPQTTLPADYNIGPGGSYNSVGQATGGMTINPNQFITSQPNAGGMSSGGSSGGSTTSFTPSYAPSPVNYTPLDFGPPPATPQTPVDINPGGYLGGIPTAALRPGMNLSTVGGAGLYGRDVVNGTAYYDQLKTKPIGPNDWVGGNAQIWVDYPRAFGGTQGYTRENMIMTGDAPHPNPYAGGARPEIIYNPTNAPISVINSGNTMRMLDYGTPRYALGTDVSQSYANAGLGSLYMPSSGNPQLAGMELPPALKMLADYGVPISPSLATSATGAIAPALNTAYAFNQRGGGVLPSLQTFANQTQGETENYRGYAEGVVGVPWNDLVDYLGKPTRNLRTVNRAQGWIG